MVHVTAAIGLALAFLLEAMFWSVAPTIIAILVGVIVLGATLWTFVRARGKRRGR